MVKKYIYTTINGAFYFEKYLQFTCGNSQQKDCRLWVTVKWKKSCLKFDGILFPNIPKLLCSGCFLIYQSYWDKFTFQSKHASRTDGTWSHIFNLHHHQRKNQTSFFKHSQPLPSDVPFHINLHFHPYFQHLLPSAPPNHSKARKQTIWEMQSD